MSESGVSASGTDGTGTGETGASGAGTGGPGADGGGPGGGGKAPGALVGVVLVSHSAAVAGAVAELAVHLTGGGTTVPVAPAGGGPDGGLGTSSDLITAAARSVDRGAGIAVLADLGSAVLTVQALLGDDELPPNARLVDAPFLEGAVAAVVTASTGADLDAVAAAAGEAYDYRKV